MSFTPYIAVISELRVPRPIFAAILAGPETFLRIPLPDGACDRASLAAAIAGYQRRLHGSAGPFGAVIEYRLVQGETECHVVTPDGGIGPAADMPPPVGQGRLTLGGKDVTQVLSRRAVIGGLAAVLAAGAAGRARAAGTDLYVFDRTWRSFCDPFDAGGNWTGDTGGVLLVRSVVAAEPPPPPHLSHDAAEDTGTMARWRAWELALEQHPANVHDRNPCPFCGHPVLGTCRHGDHARAVWAAVVRTGADSPWFSFRRAVPLTEAARAPFADTLAEVRLHAA
jgi:hypothetical protein